MTTPLTRRPLGRAGLSVFPIALGTVKIGRTAGLKYAAPVTLPTDEQALTLLRTARDLGVNLIDTAPAYGSSEARLGTLWPRIWQRHELLLCTKVGEIFDEATATSTYDFSPSHIRASIDRSLTRLGTDHVDVALLHFRGNDDLDAITLREGQALGTLRDLQRAGKVRAVGASIGTPDGGLLAASFCDVVMLSLHATPEGLAGDTDTLAACAAANTGVLIKKPLASGHTNLAPAHALSAVLAAQGVTAAVVGTANPAHLSQLCTRC